MELAVAVGATNAVWALASTVRDLRKERRETRKSYALYRNVMASQEPKSWSTGDPTSGMRANEIREATQPRDCGQAQ